MAYKNIANNTDRPIDVRLYVRTGSTATGRGRFDGPPLGEPSVSLTIPPSQRQRVEYGDATNPYLDAIVVDYADGDWREYVQRSLMAEAHVSEPGPQDQELNTHDTVSVTHPSKQHLELIMSNAG